MGHPLFTRNVDKKGSAWTGKIRGSLNLLDDDDGRFLEKCILAQAEGDQTFDIDEHEYARYLKHKVRRPEGAVIVSVPQDTENEDEQAPHSEIRESFKYRRFSLVSVHETELKIWLPRNDRNSVLSEWKTDNDALVENLPLNYEKMTIRTIAIGIECVVVAWPCHCQSV